MSEQPDTTTVPIPREMADELLTMLTGYALLLSDSPPIWMDDDDLERRTASHYDVDRMIARLARHTGRAAPPR